MFNGPANTLKVTSNRSVNSHFTWAAIHYSGESVLAHIFSQVTDNDRLESEVRMGWKRERGERNDHLNDFMTNPFESYVTEQRTKYLIQFLNMIGH